MARRGVLLIRHGETDGNRSRKLQVESTPLNDNGHEQALKLGRRVAAQFKVHKIICSDLTRTQQTAAPLAELTGLPVKLNPLLQERSFGELRGQMFAKLAEQGINPFATGYAPPGGESIEVFERRCDRAWRLVLDEAEGTPEGQVLAVVTHGLVLDYFARKHVQVPGGVGPSLILFTNTSVTHIDTSGAHNPYPVLGELFNDDSHLSDENRDKTYGKFISSI